MDVILPTQEFALHSSADSIQGINRFDTPRKHRQVRRSEQVQSRDTLGVPIVKRASAKIQVDCNGHTITATVGAVHEDGIRASREGQHSIMVVVGAPRLIWVSPE